ncbi:efflux system membrane protein [compost metagenome]
MLSEIDLYGVFVPGVLVLMVLAFAVTTAIRMTLAALGCYRHIWHRSLFNLSLYVIVLSAVAAVFAAVPGLPS